MTRGSLSCSVPDVTFKKPAGSESLELDTETKVPKSATSNVATEKEYPSLAAEKPKLFASEGIFQKSSFVSPPQSKLDPGLIPIKYDTQQLQVARKDNGFTFPVVPSGSQVPPTPSMPLAVSDNASGSMPSMPTQSWEKGEEDRILIFVESSPYSSTDPWEKAWYLKIFDCLFDACVLGRYVSYASAMSRLDCLLRLCSVPVVICREVRGRVMVFKRYWSVL